MADRPPASPAEAPADQRVYLPDHERFQVRIMSGVEREYCFQKAPGQDHYHLIVPGELYVDSGDERLCFNCALRRGVLTVDRLFWQKHRL